MQFRVVYGRLCLVIVSILLERMNLLVLFLVILFTEPASPVNRRKWKRFVTSNFSIKELHNLLANISTFYHSFGWFMATVKYQYIYFVWIGSVPNFMLTTTLIVQSFTKWRMQGENDCSAPHTHTQTVHRQHHPIYGAWIGPIYCGICLVQQHYWSRFFFFLSWQSQQLPQLRQ